MEQGDLAERTETQKLPLKDGLITLRRLVEFYHCQFGNVVILVEGAWGTGKTTLRKMLANGIGKIPSERIRVIDIKDKYLEGELYKEERRASGGKNLITVLYPDETQRPDILIIETDTASSRRILTDEISIGRENVIIVNLCPDYKTRWNNLHKRGYSVREILETIRNSPTEIDVEAINIDNSLQYRLPPEEITNILRCE
jgi:broad-specificity NMP kinase